MSRTLGDKTDLARSALAQGRELRRQERRRENDAYQTIVMDEVRMLVADLRLHFNQGNRPGWVHAGEIADSRPGFSFRDRIDGIALLLGVRE